MSKSDCTEVLQKRIAELTEEINEEMAEWQKNGIDPKGPNQLPFFAGQNRFLDMQIEAVISWLVKKFGSTVQLELEVEVKEKFLEAAKAIRPVAVMEMQKAGITRGIIGPDGKPILQ